MAIWLTIHGIILIGESGAHVGEILGKTFIDVFRIQALGLPNANWVSYRSRIMTTS